MRERERERDASAYEARVCLWFLKGSLSIRVREERQGKRWGLECLHKLRDKWRRREGEGAAAAAGERQLQWQSVALLLISCKRV